MKLKKIVSLAMAGVLAVSMLAGCEFGTGSSSSTPTQQPAAKDLVGMVVAKLDEEVGDHVTVTAGAGLQTTLEEMAMFYGNASGSISSDFTNANMKSKFDPDVSTTVIPARTADATSVDKTDGKEQTYTVVGTVTTADDSNLSYVAEKIFKEIEDDEFTGETDYKVLKALPSAGNDVATVTDGTADCYYTFKYTVEVAVVTLDDPADSGLATNYAYAVTVTRTPTKVDL